MNDCQHTGRPCEIRHTAAGTAICTAKTDEDLALTTPADRDDIAAAFAEDRARQLRSRAEYRAHPHAGNYSGLRQPCHGCGKPTYSKHATCNNCKGER